MPHKLQRLVPGPRSIAALSISITLSYVMPVAGDSTYLDADSDLDEEGTAHALLAAVFVHAMPGPIHLARQQCSLARLTGMLVCCSAGLGHSGHSAFTNAESTVEKSRADGSMQQQQQPPPGGQEPLHAQQQPQTLLGAVLV